MVAGCRILGRTLPVIGALAGSAATPAGAVTTTLFVTTTGSGSVCTEASPCGSVQAAVTTASTDAGADPAPATATG
jgi:hypothetical protein